MERPPDLEIAAAVRADEVRFEVKPRVRVVAYSDWPAMAETDAARQGLPDEVEPGVTYRDVAARWWVGVRLGDPEGSGRRSR
jgi:hypothetical protein